MTTTRESKRILSVTVKRIADYDADTSDLGEYSDDPKEFAIVAVGEHEGEFVKDLPCECGHGLSEHTIEDEFCAACKDCTVGFDPVLIERGREYRYFNPLADNYAGIDDAEIRKYCQQDYQRMRDLQRGEWGFVGITSEAVVQLNGDLTQTIHSGGLWGIESDSEDSYLTEVEEEQLSELREQLHAVGFSKRAIAAAFRNVQRSEE